MTLRISDLSRGGAGVAREPSGRVIFVPYTAPGDLVRVRIIEDPDGKGRFANAELIEILEPSPERVTPPCSLFGRCGGCQWQHLPYARQWATKVSGVRHALARTQVPVPENFDELPAQRIWEYRNRIQLRGRGDQLGFFAARSNDLVPAQRCEIARPEINAAWESTRQEGVQEGVQEGAKEARAPSQERLFKVELEVLPNGEIRKTWNAPHGAAGFRQVHDDQNALLQDWVAKQLTSGHELLDLYGGSGNLSLPLAQRMSRIDCVDTGSPATRPAGTPENLHFHRSAVLGWLLRQVAMDGRKQGRPKGGTQAEHKSAILDPPREGLQKDAPEIIGALEALGVREVVAVGCDPDSWARDLSRFLKRGWKLKRAAVLDLFPQTPHVESIAYLRSPFDSSKEET